MQLPYSDVLDIAHFSRLLITKVSVINYSGFRQLHGKLKRGTNNHI